ncbi:MAG TPA: murein L,D-transpeptidase catalytic domain family protein [Puia sp.]|nr:murein L,D-transpeptidase catalytic domain family protein [Puia sp.]
MKTFHPICLVVGLIVLSASCKIFSKNKSRESLPVENKTDFSATGSNNADERSTASHLNQAIKYIEQHGYSTEYCFLVDMRICSGKNRFFVYDLRKNTVALSGLVAHGSCNSHFLELAKFSNTPSCGCSSLGRYKVGTSYSGEFGKSYRLYGLDSTNSNAFKRAIVLHGFGPVPDEEIYPRALCNSFGCPMVSRTFLNKISGIIDGSKKPILLWIYE